jgi:hypothetical protein
MQNLLEQGAEAVDFRIIRTQPKNVILTVTSDSALDLAPAESLQFKVTPIESVQPALRSFFQI